jgi:hypothetical protein
MVQLNETSEFLAALSLRTVRFEDCLKCCAVGPVGAGSWITAGHDQMVKLWDERSKPDKPAIAAAWLTWGVEEMVDAH